MSEERHEKQSRANKSFGTLYLFEEYWVHGSSADAIGAGSGLLERNGIPMRSQEDAQSYRRGSVRLVDLWDEYLTPFQLRLAQELWTLHMQDAKSETDQ